jgi:2-oxoglutarate dehydrogenase E2 component (dihydrolipoamide succinyltransferase)
MATDIVIPQLGESITEAVIASWLKSDGDYVERDEEIVELETDKVTMPLPSPAAGVLKHGAGEGDTVEVGSNIGSIDESAEKPAGDAKRVDKQAEQPAEDRQEKAEAPKKEAAASAGGNGAATERPAANVTATASPNGAPAPERSADESDTRATPVAKRLASEYGVELSRVRGTGPGGRVREDDVLAFIQAQENGSAGPVSAPSTGAGGGGGASREVKRERMSQLRKSIAVRLVEAQQTAAMLTTFNECDMTNVMAMRSAHKDAFAERHGIKLGFMSFFVKAVCEALQRYPAVNSFIVQGEKGVEVESHGYCDVAIAVGTEKGLVVPVLRNAEGRSFAEIESGIAELAEKARKGTLTIEEMQGGTFTITNGGIYGSMMSTPILNPPQSGILGMHNIVKRPVEHPDTPGEIALRPMMYLALSYDHRIVDGAGAVGFLKHVKECIEEPGRMLVGA